MSTLHNSPDPEGLAIAREIQDRLRPAEVILFGSRADGSHSPGSDVDLIAIAPDETAAGQPRHTCETSRRRSSANGNGRPCGATCRERWTP